MFKTIVITNPSPITDEATHCNTLFAHGLKILHLRKPNADKSEMCQFLNNISPDYRDRIVIHSHYNLVEEYGLKGIHLKSGEALSATQYANIKHISISCHSIDEIKNLPFKATYAFLSPIFESISKVGYKPNECGVSAQEIKSCQTPVIALGGIIPERVSECMNMGFSGVATLGYIWQDPDNAAERFTRLTCPTILSIAGFDPSSGAGVSADIKSAEWCGAYCLGTVTSVTFQNADNYIGCEWLSAEQIIRQLDTLLEAGQPSPIVAKIGLIESADTLLKVTDWLKARCPNIKIVWDPILQATAAIQAFHGEALKRALPKLLENIDIITPNAVELTKLFGDLDQTSLIQKVRECNTAILRKGGHDEKSNASIDTLYEPNGESHIFPLTRVKYGKHGTGCLLSTAIAAYWAKGYTLSEACNKAQLKIIEYLNSNETKLGYRGMGKANATIPSPKNTAIQYITDHKQGMTIAEQVEAVCRAGVRWVQLRMKDSTDQEMLVEGKKVKEICHRYNAIFTINDRVFVARQLNADGVHLGKSDMSPTDARRILGEDKIIGATCNTFEDLVTAHSEMVDYVGVGPFRFTTTKKNLSPTLGLQGYKKMLQKAIQAGIKTPVFAIGGIVADDFEELFRTGISGVALSGTILHANSPESVARELNIAAEAYKNENRENI